MAVGAAAASRFPASAARAEGKAIRIGVLKFGTVSWMLDVVRRHRLDKEAGVRIDVVELAGAQATQVALQAGSVDTIVGDLLWVARQRREGADWAFLPY